MEGFGLLVGHLVGDFIIQSDYLAKNKVNPYCGSMPDWNRLPDESIVLGSSRETMEKVDIWKAKKHRWIVGHIACTIHCFLYTLAVWIFSFLWMPWWGLLLCFLTHWPIDRFRLARKLMTVMHQEEFATGPLAPWSVIVVDNTLHLCVL